MGTYPRIYHWDGETNFGDLLGPAIAAHYGAPCRRSPPESAELLSVGSILHKCPPHFDGVVLGSGHISRDDRSPNLEDAIVLAVRGPLTADKLAHASPVVLGDPGILTSKIWARPKSTDVTIGIVPHYADIDCPSTAELLRRIPNALLIDVRRPPELVVPAIAGCAAILSSSLHGLVVADSFGLPAAWLVLGDRLHGGRFKFDDYHFGIGIRREPLSASQASRSAIRNARLLAAPAILVHRAQWRLECQYAKLRPAILSIRLRRLLRKAVDSLPTR